MVKVRCLRFPTNTRQFSGRNNAGICDKEDSFQLNGNQSLYFLASICYHYLRQVCSIYILRNGINHIFLFRII